MAELVQILPKIGGLAAIGSCFCVFLAGMLGVWEAMLGRA